MAHIRLTTIMGGTVSEGKGYLVAGKVVVRKRSREAKAGVVRILVFLHEKKTVKKLNAIKDIENDIDSNYNKKYLKSQSEN